jgi:hypothetical protein
MRKYQKNANMCGGAEYHQGKQANEEPKGLAAWMPGNVPHIYAYSNLLRNSVAPDVARKMIEEALEKAGIK